MMLKLADEGHQTRRIWLVRHGLTAWNAQQRFCGQSDIPLEPAGRAQASWLAHRLRAEPLLAIYTSDLLRTRETAEIILGERARKLPVWEMAAWREINFGAWEGLTYAEIVENFPEQLDFFTGSEHSRSPGGESLAQLKVRVLAALDHVVATHPFSTAGDLLIVSHGGPLRVLLTCALGMPLERQWQLSLNPGSLSALDLLPVQDASAPKGILVLLNVHGSDAHSTSALFQHSPEDDIS